MSRLDLAQRFVDRVQRFQSLTELGDALRDICCEMGFTYIFPFAKAGKPRKFHIPDQHPVSAEAVLAAEKWQKASWRRGTKGRLTCLFAARRVRVAEGHKHRMLDNRMQCMPGD